MGFALGCIAVIGGVAAVATAGSNSGGWVLVIVGLVVATSLWYGRPIVYQLEIGDMPKGEEGKWYISRPRGFARENGAEAFARLVRERTAAGEWS